MKLKNILKKIKKQRCLEDITIDEIQKIIQKNNDITLLDVRSRQEFEEGHLLRAINIPAYEIEKKIENRIRDKNKVIIVYCSAGIRSKKATKILKKLGYINVYNIKDGIE